MKCLLYRFILVLYTICVSEWREMDVTTPLQQDVYFTRDCEWPLKWNMASFSVFCLLYQLTEETKHCGMLSKPTCLKDSCIACNVLASKLNFYFWVLHPVACIIKVIGSADHRNNFLKMFICCRYMFRPLLAIFRRNTHLVPEVISPAIQYNTTDPL
jgi:hypothetical protein